MKIISHRGNVEGPNEQTENTVGAIEVVVNILNFDCEVDLWVRDKSQKLYLGHDFGTNFIQPSFIHKYCNKLWIHCKNVEALEWCMNNNWGQLNFFWHAIDKYTLTSKQYVWVYPGQPFNFIEKCVVVGTDSDPAKIRLDTPAICTDYSLKYDNYYNYK